MGFVDTVFVGRLGPEAIGAVGIGTAIFGTLAIFGMGLLLGLVLDRPAKAVQQALFARQVLVGSSEDPNVMRLLPPLVLGAAEVENTLRDLAAVHCQVVTIGQYLRPTGWELPVVRYWAPPEFAELEAFGRSLGLEVIAGPFVRSSYHAEEAFLRVTM
jgi:hypothetical protein